MTNITNTATKEIKKTEDMARGVFYGSFKNIDDKRLEDELEIKISKWEKELKEYIENNNPYEANKIELDVAFKKFKNKKSSNKSYNKNEIINYLNSFKEIDKNIDYNFWIDRLNNENFNIIEKNILSSWEKSYNDKNNIWTLNTIKGKRDKFIVDMESWIKLLKKLKYMSNILRIKTGVLWDFRIGELSEDDISLLKRWIDFINDYKDIEIICESMGRRVDIENAINNIEFKDSYNYSNKKITSKDEIVGIYFSKDIENIVPEELSLLCDRDFEKLFKLKYIENRLMCFDKNSYIFDERETRKIQSGYIDGRGPVIICIDTSGSMKGINEYIAKATMLKIVMQALSEDRNVYLINFSVEIYSCKFSKNYGLNELIDFLKLSYHGGSDIYKALYEANRIMKTDDFKNADVLVLSDFIMEDMSYHLIELCDKQKLKGNKFFAVSIGKFPFGYSYRKVFNKHWIFDIDNGLKSIY
ncbi:VWA domain-containing protein [Brachyspira aalborgi]|uniref:VWA domain-containing protein n=1 Tax=Brachyspira aalborgi TaxID=29522 RepID=UPI00266528EC|nr:VWA domain-containing protein [Brachyspira aalborgi]